MRPDLVEVLSPDFDHDLCFGPTVEPFQAQALVAELAIEAIGTAILPRLARLDVNRPAFRRHS